MKRIFAVVLLSLFAFQPGMVAAQEVTAEQAAADAAVAAIDAACAIDAESCAAAIEAAVAALEAAGFDPAVVNEKLAVVAAKAVAAIVANPAFATVLAASIEKVAELSTDPAQKAALVTLAAAAATGDVPAEVLQAVAQRASGN